MLLKITKITLLLALLNCVNVFGQTQKDVDKQREEYISKAEDLLAERINLFIKDLNVDDFQKEIIKQKINSYYEVQKSIVMDPSLKYYERDEQISTLTNTHFSDIKNLITEETMDQIQIFIKDGGTTLEKQKKKSKKNKKKKDE